MVGIEDERLMLMLRYFSICFHIPLSNRDVSTYGHFICGFTCVPVQVKDYVLHIPPSIRHFKQVRHTSLLIYCRSIGLKKIN